MAIELKQRLKEGKSLPTRYFSDKQEKSVAKAVGGVQTPNSGATPWIKGDVAIKSLISIECKTKTKHSNSITIKKEWLLKNLEESLFMGKKFNALAFNFGPNEENYYIIDEYLFKELLRLLQEGDV